MKTILFSISFLFVLINVSAQKVVEQAEFKLDPNTLERLPMAITYRFYHTEDQQQHLQNQLYLYSQSPIGLGRLLQRSNLKMLYRTIERVQMA